MARDLLQPEQCLNRGDRDDVLGAHRHLRARPPAAARRSGPSFLFDRPELQFPEQLNCATELLDRWVERRAGRPPVRAGPAGVRWTYADLQAQANRIARVLVRGSGPGARQPRAAARRQLPDARGLLVRGGQGRRHRGGQHAAAARQGADADRRTRPQITHALCDARLAEELALARPACPTLKQVLHFNSAGRERARGARRRASRPRSTNVDDRGRRHLPHRLHLGHHRPAQGHDALPPRRDGRLRLLAARTCCGRRPTTSSSAARRWPSPSGWAGCCCSRCRSAPRRCCSRRPRPTRCRRRSRSTAPPSASPRRPRTARWRRSWRGHDLSSLRKCVAPARRCRRRRASCGRTPPASR